MKKTIAILSLGLLVWSCSSQPRSVPVEKTIAPSQEQRDTKEMEESLRQAGERLVEVIRQGDAQDLLKLFSRKGAEIGIDNVVSYREIRKDLGNRGFIYCQFFDTACFRMHLGRMRTGTPEDLYGPLPDPVSYREVLNKVSGLKISVKLERSPSGEIWGQVMLGWDSPRPRDLGFLQFLNFPFGLENEEWKLGGDSGNSY